MHYFRGGAPLNRLFLLLSLLMTLPSARAQGLSAPTLVAAPDGTTVALQWTDFEGYSTNRIYRKSGAFDWTLVAETGQANHYWDRSTVGGVTYTYRVQAVTLDGRSTYSNEAAATTTGPSLQPPAQLYFTVQVSFNNFLVQWMPREEISGYKIEMMDAYTPWRELVTLGAGSSNYLISPLIEGMTYYLRMSVSNHAGVSPYTDLMIKAPYDPSIRPQTPSISAFPHTDRSIALQWNFEPRAWGYIVESRTSLADSWVRIVHVGGEVTFAFHENLQPSTQYFYRILAFNGAGDSPFSSEVSVSTYPPPPASPELQGMPVSYKEVELRWSDVLTNCCPVPGFIGYRLERWHAAQWREIAFLGVNETNYFVDGLQPSTEYTFRVEALHPLSSGWSTNTIRTMDPPPIAPPTAPVFYADPYSAIAVDLKWLDVYLETEYRIERENYPGGGVWQQIAVVPGDTTSYRDINLNPGTTYVYRIRAANPYGATDYSHEAAATTPLLPGFPSLEGAAISSTAVILTGGPAEGALNYQLQRFNRNDEWDVLYETNSAPFRFEDTGLMPRASYTYRVAARMDSRAPVWAYSPEVSVTLPDSISGDVRFTSITSSPEGITLRLSGSTGQKFKIQSTVDFTAWSDRTEALTLMADMEVAVAANGSALFYRSIKVD